jgi:tyrosine aminotransferase
VAGRYGIVIIADEIYEDMVFENFTYFPLAGLSQEFPEVNTSVLTCSGLAKRFLVPGWRFGWIAIHEAENDVLSEIRKGLFDLATLIIGSCTLIQAALPEIFENTPETFFTETNSILQSHARYLCHELSQIEGVHVIEPQGTLYMMVGIQFEQFKGKFGNDVEFSEQLLASQSVSVLPASVN